MAMWRGEQKGQRPEIFQTPPNSQSSTLSKWGTVNNPPNFVMFLLVSFEVWLWSVASSLWPVMAVALGLFNALNDE